MSEFAAFLGSALAPLILAVVVIVTAIVTIHTFRFLHVIKADASHFRCANCGNFLTADSVDLADAHWRRCMDQLLRDNPGHMFHVVRNVHAICPACNAEYSYNEARRRFALHDTRLSHALAAQRDEANAGCGQPR